MSDQPPGQDVLRERSQTIRKIVQAVLSCGAYDTEGVYWTDMPKAEARVAAALSGASSPGSGETSGRVFDDDGLRLKSVPTSGRLVRAKPIAPSGDSQ